MEAAPDWLTGTPPIVCRGFPPEIDTTQRRALTAAAPLLIDDWPELRDCIVTGLAWDLLPACEDLPRQFARWYTADFISMMLVVAIAVLDRLSLQSPPRPVLQCTAEELATHALRRRAVELLRELTTNQYEGDRTLGDFRAFAFEDEDFLYLFRPELDGVENDVDHPARFVLLHPRDWFKPAWGDIHPVLAGFCAR